MESLSRTGNQKVLVVDDIASMRSQIASNLAAMGFKDVLTVASCQKALASIAHVSFDLILCDYHLGEVTSGQQFLEHLRSKKLIPPSTLFVMVTARRVHEEVIRAAEFAPDDYLVKPFTGAQLNARLSKLLEKRARLQGVHAALEKKEWSTAIKLCDGIVATNPQLAMDVNKIKGQALLRAERFTEAEALYRSVLNTRALGWAQLGLARALKAQQALQAAEKVLDGLLAEGGKNSASDRMCAYDELSEVLLADNRGKEALAIMQEAMELSSGSLARARKFTQLAVAEDNLLLAEKTVRKIVADQRYSQVKEAGDYLLAAEVLASAGFANDALATLSEVRKSFDDPQDSRTLAIAEIVAHVAIGDAASAEKLLSVAAVETATELPANVAATLGKALYRMGNHAAADKVMRQLVQNNPGDQNVIRSVHATLAAVGKQADAAELVQSSLDEVVEINDQGVRLAYAGQLDEAVALLTQAAELLPGNTQFVSNAALVIALALSKADAVDRDRYAACLRYRKQIAAREPAHPKLAQIDGLLKTLSGDGNDAASRSA